MVTLTARIKAKPGKEAALVEECVKLAKLVRENEQGCLMYIPHVSQDDPGEVVFFEKYVDEAAFELHGKTPYFTAFAAALDELMSGDLEIQFLRELI
ncbi:MAG: antibiotic biosynthesis monooxygenase [Peptococcaceae bacterium]|nr:antibiotic biosynthesis monooxygenase [Peptococcaceae bacterium]